ncbi:unnamed protein product [Cuscuta campestris]|uniref:CCHC-type domain-containing protein n=1 Tax=Cuscuta campestris TaxID=132261 RepID=A0A484LSZ3_9ASTE|nr:unnamed protein product [Cuscuta campestris]
MALYIGLGEGVTRKSIALKATKEVVEENEEDDDESLNLEDNPELARVIKRFNKFIKKSFKPRRDNGKIATPPKCYECGEIGHIKPYCPKLKQGKDKKFKKKQKAYISWESDHSSSETSDEDEETANLCLMATEEEVSSNSFSNPLSSSSDCFSLDDLHSAFSDLYGEFLKSTKETKLAKENVTSLEAQIIELNKEMDLLKLENKKLGKVIYSVKAPSLLLRLKSPILSLPQSATHWNPSCRLFFTDASPSLVAKLFFHNWFILVTKNPRRGFTDESPYLGAKLFSDKFMASRTKRKTIRQPDSSSLPGSSSQPQSTPEVPRFVYPLNPRVYFEDEADLKTFLERIVPRKIDTPRYVDLAEFERNQDFESVLSKLRSSGLLNVVTIRETQVPFDYIKAFYASLIFKRRGSQFVVTAKFCGKEVVVTSSELNSMFGMSNSGGEITTVNNDQNPWYDVDERKCWEAMDFTPQFNSSKRPMKRALPYPLLVTHFLKQKGFEFTNAEMTNDTPFWRIRVETVTRAQDVDDESSDDDDDVVAPTQKRPISYRGRVSLPMIYDAMLGLQTSLDNLKIHQAIHGYNLNKLLVKSGENWEVPSMDALEPYMKGNHARIGSGI